MSPYEPIPQPTSHAVSDPVCPVGATSLPPRGAHGEMSRHARTPLHPLMGGVC